MTPRDRSAYDRLARFFEEANAARVLRAQRWAILHSDVFQWLNEPFTDK